MAAFRFGPREAATCVALLSGVAIWATLQGAGPFGRSTQDELLLLLGAFIGTMAVATPLLAALVKELARLAEIVRASEDGIVATIVPREGEGSKEVRVTHVLLASGRVSNIEGLNVEKVGIETHRPGIVEVLDDLE